MIGKTFWKALILACLFCAPARAERIEVGRGLVCDNAAQVARFLAVLNGDPHAAVEQVNAEVSNPTACVLIGVAFVIGTEGEVIRNAEGSWKVTEVLVVGIETPMGWSRIAPQNYFTAFRVSEEAI